MQKSSSSNPERIRFSHHSKKFLFFVCLHFFLLAITAFNKNQFFITFAWETRSLDHQRTINFIYLQKCKIKKLTCKPTSRKCSLTQFLKVFACISTHRSSLPRMFIPFAAVPSGERATKPACVIFWMSVLPSALCCINPVCVIFAPFGNSIIIHFEISFSLRMILLFNSLRNIVPLIIVHHLLHHHNHYYFFYHSFFFIT